MTGTECDVPSEILTVVTGSISVTVSYLRACMDVRCVLRQHHGHDILWALLAGIPVASRLLQDLPGYSLYKAAQMPFGSNSADFACAQSYTSKQICELPGNLTVSHAALYT